MGFPVAHPDVVDPVEGVVQVVLVGEGHDDGILEGMLAYQLFAQLGGTPFAGRSCHAAL